MYDFCITFPYGGLLILGGISGFVSSGSIKSLVAGGVSGALLMVLGNVSLDFYKRGKLCKPATFGCLLLSLALTAVMYKRYSDTGKIMPAGILLVVSALMAVFYVWNLALGPSAPDKPIKKKAKKMK